MLVVSIIKWRIDGWNASGPTIINQPALKNMFIIIAFYLFSKPLGTTSVINKHQNPSCHEQFINGDVKHHGHIIIYSYESPLQETKPRGKNMRKKGKRTSNINEQQNDNEMIPGEETEVGFHLEV